MTFNQYIEQRFNGKTIIRITDDVAFFYQLKRDSWIDLIDCSLAWNKKNYYCSKIKLFLKSGYDEKNILTHSSYESMVDSLKTQHRLHEFEKSDRDFPKELFEPKKK